MSTERDDDERKRLPRPPRPRNLTRWRPVDRVALVLALGLTLSVLLILLVSALQVIRGRFPQVELSENATQVLIAGTGGLTGLLGAYVGLNRDSSRRKKDDEDEPPPLD